LSDLPGVLSKLIGVFALAFFSFSYAVPVGLALGLGPVLIAITAWASYTSGVVLAILLGDPLRKRLLARFGGKLTGNPKNLVWRVWERYGLIGLSLLAPMTTGAQIGAILGLSLGVPPRRLMIGLTLGAALWSITITAAITFGLTALQTPR
jgi:uncharacterized membrane protein